jgi:pimeloyl-ACP methyl ester carboxylesterase
LATLDLPIMIIWGAQDRAIPVELGQRMHQMLPRSSFFSISEAGHVPNLEQPEAFNARVVAFLGHAPHPEPT